MVSPRLNRRHTRRGDGRGCQESGPARQRAQWKVAVGVGIGLALAAAPLAFKEVRAREQSVAQMRDAQYEKQGSKDDARDARLKRGKK